MKFTVVIEKAPNNFSAYVPDLPGCVATGKFREDVVELIEQAVSLHLEGMREDGLEIPVPQASSALVEV